MRVVVVAGRGESREVVLGVGGHWVWCQAGGRLAPGAGVGCGAGWAGGGQKKPRQALQARRLRHAERTVLLAVAQSKKGGGGLVGPAWARAVVGCGVRRLVASAGGEGWGARVVRGGVSLAACRGCRVWELHCLRSRAGLWGSVACGAGGCVLLPVSYYEEVMRVKTAWGLRPESLGRWNGVLAAGYPRLGWPGCPGAPWGRRLPTSAGCETTACISVTEVLRFRPQELTRRGDCGPGRPRGMIMKRKWGARMSLAGGTCAMRQWTYRTPSQITIRQGAETKCIVVTHDPAPFCAPRVCNDT